MIDSLLLVCYNSRVMKKNTKHTIEAYGIRGFKRIPWHKSFKSVDELNLWVDRNGAEVYGVRDLEK